MRKVIFSSLISLLLLLPSLVRADEGMWFLMFLKRLNERDMQKQGLQLTADLQYQQQQPQECHCAVQRKLYR